MTPQSTDQNELLLFQAHFDQLLNPAHPLLKLADQIDWDGLPHEWWARRVGVDQFMLAS